MPFPRTDEIAGDKEETPTPAPRVSAVLEQSGERLPSVVEAQKLLHEYMKQGFVERAVVVPAELDFEAQLNPRQWGIVVRTEWFKPWPLCVTFCNGQISWCKKEALKLIWPGMPTKEARDYFSHMTGPIQTKQ